MPCSICRRPGHNKRTHWKHAPLLEDDKAAAGTVSCSICGMQGFNKRTHPEHKHLLEDDKAAAGTVSCSICGLPGYNKRTHEEHKHLLEDQTVAVTVSCSICGLEGYNKRTHEQHKHLLKDNKAAAVTLHCSICGLPGYNKRTHEEHKHLLAANVGETEVAEVAPASRVKVVNTEEEFQALLKKSDSLVMILVTADSYKRCRAFKPMFEEISKAFASYTFAKADVDTSDCSLTLTVMVLPSLFIYSKGRLIHEIEGEIGRDEVCNVITNWQNPPPTTNWQNPPPTALQPLPASAKKHHYRHALVIGNSKYQADPLKNPENDAQDMCDALRQKLGFEVDLGLDLNVIQMKEKVSAYCNKLVPESIAFVFFAGHGCQNDGKNFLAGIETEDRSDDVDEIEHDYGVRADWILGEVKKTDPYVTILILDACRKFPGLARHRSSLQGLAEMESVGSVIAYACAKDRVAYDSWGKSRDNSPFTKHLLLNLTLQKDIAMMLRAVVKGVFNETGKKQRPYWASDVDDDFCLALAEPLSSQSARSFVINGSPRRNKDEEEAQENLEKEDEEAKEREEEDEEEEEQEHRGWFVRFQSLVGA